MIPDIEGYLFHEKVQRDDASSYIGNLLVRQRLINERTFQFAEPFLPAGSLVIDACAGPEGSFLATTRRGHQWIGNDISHKFAGILKNEGASVVLSDFPNAPFCDRSADAVFFIFALNNICNPKMAFREAARITRNSGLAVVTEPGLSIWITKILFHSILSHTTDPSALNYLKRRKFSAEVEAYFADKPFSEHEYANFMLEGTIGITADILLPKVRDTIDLTKKRAKTYFGFHEALTEAYFENISEQSKQAGFKMVKTGILAVTQTSAGWDVSQVAEIPTESWINQLIQIRKWQRDQTPLLNIFPTSMDRAAKRMVIPILCMKKVEPASLSGSLVPNYTLC